MFRALASFVALIGASFLLTATAANAQATRTWVSGVGDDVNPCSRTAPCKTFAGAISKTAIGGEINCLDPAGYGAVTITKAITIDCEGTNGSILSSNVNGVLVNAGTGVVTLRNITINGANSTTGNGIRIIGGSAVNLDHVVLENFGGTGANGRGVAIETTADIRVDIRNSAVYNANNIGIHSNPTTGNVTLTIDNVSVAHTIAGSGVQLRQNTTGMINRLTASNNVIGAGVGLELSSTSATVSNSVLVNNAFGILVGNGGSPTVRVYGSTISGSTGSGLQITSGQIISSGNNIIRGNAGNEAPSSTPGQQ
jgi:hypothetical protein